MDPILRIEDQQESALPGGRKTTRVFNRKSMDVPELHAGGVGSRGLMALIPVEKAQVGMVLAAPVADRRGRLLMPAGKALGERHLDALPMWGIAQIEVEGEEDLTDDIQEQVAPWAVAKAGEEMAHRLLHADLSHPAMKELSALAIQRRAVRLQREEHHDD